MKSVKRTVAVTFLQAGSASVTYSGWLWFSEGKFYGSLFLTLIASLCFIIATEALSD